MFICKYCHKEYKRKQALSQHEKYCKENQNHIEATGFKKYNKECEDLYCQYCHKHCKSENSLHSHEIRCKENPNRIHIAYNLEKYNNSGNVWNKGLTKETDERVKNAAQAYSDKVKDGKIIPHMRGKHLSDEQKQILSIKRKEYLQNNPEAITGFKIRQNRKPSYAEQFIINIIEKEIINKNYIREYKFHRYRLDFAWPEEKLCIEIDGEQHEWKDRKERDLKKDNLLKNEGWKELRIKWKEMYHNTQEYVQHIKDFIDKPV